MSAHRPTTSDLEAASSGDSVEVVDIDTPHGRACAHLDWPRAGPSGMLLLGHGAGGGVHAPDLRAVREAALAAGAAVARVEQPYRVAGRRAPPPARHLDAAWCAVAAAMRAGPWGELPLVAGGRSSGARVACRTAADVGAAGVVALAFPLHPPGRPQRSRASELASVEVPALVVNGDRDPFGVPEPGENVTLELAPGEKHALDRHPGAVGELVWRWVGQVLAS